MRWPTVASLLLLSLSCRTLVRPAPTLEVLPVAALNVDFPKNEEGHLSFTLDVPEAAQRSVSRVSWELWIGALRFATGVEGPSAGAPQPGGTLQVKIDAPLVYRHLAWVEGKAYLTVSLKADVELSPASVTALRFQTQRELLVQGKPVLDRPDE